MTQEEALLLPVGTVIYQRTDHPRRSMINRIDIEKIKKLPDYLKNWETSKFKAMIYYKLGL